MLSIVDGSQGWTIFAQSLAVVLGSLLLRQRARPRRRAFSVIATLRERVSRSARALVEELFTETVPLSVSSA